MIENLKTWLLVICLLFGLFVLYNIYKDKPYCPTQQDIELAIRQQCPCQALNITGIDVPLFYGHNVTPGVATVT